MNDVKLLHIKCCFFQFFNSRGQALKLIPPQEKVHRRSLNECVYNAFEWMWMERVLFKIMKNGHKICVVLYIYGL